MKQFVLSTAAALGCTSLLTLFAPTLVLAQSQNYPAGERQNFIESCAYSRGNQVRAICACTYEKIKARYDYSEYQNIRQRIRSGSQLPAPVLKMIEDCRREQF
ncbi:MAG: hypothetical protein AAGG51_19710 [Cyanobacteria bacterium P01_G01_bin.54]